jgi:hypothetical protein
MKYATLVLLWITTLAWWLTMGFCSFALAAALGTLARADSINNSLAVDSVNAWAVIKTPDAGCYPNCFIKLDVNFLWSGSYIVPGSVVVNSTGFLGLFSQRLSPTYNLGMFDTPVNGLVDEINLSYGAITPGRNSDNMQFSIYACQTPACMNSYGLPGWTGGQQNEPSYMGGIEIKEGSTVRQVPAGDSALLLCLGSLGAVGLAWCWRRKESLAA